MPVPPIHSDAEIITALVKSEGVLSVAARELGYSRQQVYNRMKASDEIAAAYEALNETKAAAVEDCLVTVALDTKHPSWFQAARYYSRVKMGWKEQTSVDVTSGGEKVNEVRVTIVHPDDGGT